MLRDCKEAYELLKLLEAPDRLVHHAELVSEAAHLLLKEIHALGIECNADIVKLGAILHDSGKIDHQEELSEPGSRHEGAGELLLLAHGVQPEVARICVSHANWDFQEVSFEERVVALADKLWKGKREAALELSVIDEIAAKLGASRWDVFERLDTAFEDIAADGTKRLQESRSG